MRPALILGAVILAILGIAVAVPLDGMWPLSWVLWAPVGGLILMRRPGNGVGRSLLTVGVAWAISFLFLAVAQSDLPSELRVWADLAQTVVGLIPWVAIIGLLLVFPTGTLSGRLERITAGFIGLYLLLSMIAFSLSSAPMDVTGMPSPMEVQALEGYTVWLIGSGSFLPVAGVFVLTIVAVARRWRRSSGVERHQYRWLFLGASFFVSALLVVLVPLAPIESFGTYLMVLAGSAIPAVIGVAVLRHRLYEIDRLISRTLAYGLVVILLGAVFTLGVVALPNLVVGTGTAPPLAVAASTLAVAALFNPVRLRVQAWVDRRFNRSRYDAELVIDRFASSLRNQTDVPTVVDGWVEVVSETMQPSAVGVWIGDVAPRDVGGRQ